MNMADILAVISALIIIGLGFPALFIIVTMLFPQAVTTASASIATKPLRTLACGTLAFCAFFFAMLIIGGAAIGPLKLISLLILLTALSLAMFGGAGLANHLAARFGDFAGSRRHAFNLLCSTLLIELAAVLPFIGWFVLLPALFLIMLGAGCELAWHYLTSRRTIANIEPAAINIS